MIPETRNRHDDGNIYAWYKIFQSLSKTAEKLNTTSIAVKAAVERHCEKNRLWLVQSYDWKINPIHHPSNPNMARTENEIAKIYFREKSLVETHNVTGYPIVELKKILKIWGGKPGNWLVESPDWDARIAEPMRWDRFIELVKTKTLEQCQKILGMSEQQIEMNIRRLQMAGVQIKMPENPKKFAGKGEMVPVPRKEKKFNPGTVGMHTQGKNSTFSGKARKAKLSKKSKARLNEEKLKLGRGIQGKKPIATTTNISGT